jgi:hypothetical protein
MERVGGQWRVSAALPQEKVKNGCKMLAEKHRGKVRFEELAYLIFYLWFVKRRLHYLKVCSVE